MTYSIHTLAQKPEMRDQIDQLSDESWPPFLLHGNIHHWHWLFEIFPEYQLLLCDAAGGLIAVGHTVPLIWDGSLSDLPTTMEEILLRAEEAQRQGQPPTTLSAMAAMVRSAYRGQNLSVALIQEMRSLARQHACTALIAPVRPTWKSRYPLAPMERYVAWKRSDGAPLDPWMRVHWQIGAMPLCIAPNTLTVEGTIKDWEEWTDMAFPESGLYVVPGALQPVKIDYELNTGRYEDPNYWMKHDLSNH
jgi:GNAT superfamily N-acetyltransferase